MKGAKATKTNASLPAWNPEGLRIEATWIANGVLLYTCYATNCMFPVGSCWVSLNSNSFGQGICEILDIYVPQNARRHGVATHLLRFLLNAYGILRTGTGTKDGGMAVLKSMGWKRNRDTGDWYLRGQTKQVIASS